MEKKMFLLILQEALFLIFYASCKHGKIYVFDQKLFLVLSKGYPHFCNKTTVYCLPISRCTFFFSDIRQKKTYFISEQIMSNVTEQLQNMTSNKFSIVQNFFNLKYFTQLLNILLVNM